MIDKHLDKEVLSRLAAQASLAEELGSASQHLSRCVICRERLSTLSRAIETGAPSEPESPQSYAEIFSRLRRELPGRAAKVVSEKVLAEQLVAELSQLQPLEQLHAAQVDPRLRLRPVVELLLAKCRASWIESPEQAERYAELAIEIAETMCPSEHGSASLNDLRAQRWAYLGNIRRIQSDARAAEDAFSLALSFLELGSGDPLVRAEVLDLEASLRRDQRRFQESIQLLEMVTRAYRRAGDEHLVGRALVKKALVYNEAGEPDRSITVLRKAGSKIDGSREPRLVFVISQLLALFLARLERFEEAATALPLARRALNEVGTRFDRLRTDWTEGLIRIGQGEEQRGEELLLAAQRGFVEEQMGYDAALVSLDLALLYLRHGRAAETRRLATEMLQIFQSRDIHREALAALAVFRRAAEIETATTAMVEDIARLVERTRRDPMGRVERPS